MYELQDITEDMVPEILRVGNQTIERIDSDLEKSISFLDMLSEYVYESLASADFRIADENGKFKSPSAIADEVRELVGEHVVSPSEQFMIKYMRYLDDVQFITNHSREIMTGMFSIIDAVFPEGKARDNARRSLVEDKHILPTFDCPKFSVCPVLRFGTDRKLRFVFMNKKNDRVLEGSAEECRIYAAADCSLWGVK